MRQESRQPRPSLGSEDLTRERRDHGWGGVPDHRTDCEIWPGGPGLSASTGQDPNMQSCRRIRICLDMYPHLISPHPSPRPGPGSLTSAPTGPLWRPAAKASEAFRGGGIPGPASISVVLPVSSPHSLPSPRRPPPLPPSPTSRGRRGSSKGEGNKQNWMPGFPSQAVQKLKGPADTVVTWLFAPKRGPCPSTRPRGQTTCGLLWTSYLALPRSPCRVACVYVPSTLGSDTVCRSVSCLAVWIAQYV